MGSRHFFQQKTGSLIFIKIYRIEVQIEKICRILENLRKTFFYWKKIQLQVSKKVGFWFKFLMGNRRFFETTSEAKCPDKPRSGVAKLFYLNNQSCTFCAKAVCTKAFLLERLVLHVLCRSRAPEPFYLNDQSCTFCTEGGCT